MLKLIEESTNKNTRKIVQVSNFSFIFKAEILPLPASFTNHLQKMVLHLIDFNSHKRVIFWSKMTLKFAMFF